MAYIPAIIGAETLVPPNVNQPPSNATATPVAGSATAAKSAVNLFAQPVIKIGCQAAARL
jgi:hypothetical protein